MSCIKLVRNYRLTNCDIYAIIYDVFVTNRGEMGKHWSVNDDVFLQQLLSTSLSYTEISVKLNRSKQSVVTRYHKKFATVCPRKHKKSRKAVRDFSKGDPLDSTMQLEGELLFEAKKRHGVHLTEKQGCYYLHGQPISVHDVIFLSGVNYLTIYERVRYI